MKASSFILQTFTTAVLPHTASSITAVTPQKVTPSPQYYREIHGKIRGITAVPITVQLPSMHKNKMSIVITQRRFFPLSSLTVAKSARRNWTVNCRFLLTSLSLSLRNWMPSWQWTSDCSFRPCLVHYVTVSNVI